MGASAGKKQMLVYLPHEVCRNLAIESAKHGLSMSEMVEAALSRWSFRGKRRSRGSVKNV